MAENTYWEEELDKTGDIVLERKPRYFDCKFEIRISKSETMTEI